jgi:hypothetical protein
MGRELEGPAPGVRAQVEMLASGAPRSKPAEAKTTEAQRALVESAA